MKTEKGKVLFASSVIIFALITYLVRNNPFFWDKDVLDSAQAHWFFINGFLSPLPDKIDPGHSPFVSVMLAMLWNIFGQALWVGHAMMYLANIGVVYQTILLVERFIHKEYRVLAFLILILEPALLTQTIVVSSDLFLCFFFLLGVNAIYNRRKGLLIFTAILLGLINMRGTLSLSVLFFFELYYRKGFKSFNSWVQYGIKYIPAIIAVSVFHFWHFKTKGWVISHESSPWAGCYEVVDFKGITRNIFIIGWRMIDFGKVFIWLVVVVLGMFLIKRKETVNSKVADLLIIFILILGINLIPMLIYKNIQSHRYLVPVYFFFSLIACVLIFNTQFIKPTIKTGLASFLIIALMMGNLWRYPEKIAQGWDATLGHIPYYKLKANMITWIKDNQIDYQTIATVTPEKHAFKYYYLNGDTNSFKILSNNLFNHKYIYYTNLQNDFTDNEIDKLKNDFILLKEFKQYPIFVRLYKNPNLN